VPEPHRNGLEAAFAALVAALGRTGAPFMIIGGVAVIAHGVKRLTTDVDAVVRGDAIDVPTLLRALGRSKIVPRIENAERFARENLVLLLRHAPSHVDLDVSLGWTSFELEALEACENVRFGSVSAPMASPADLVIFKALAGRPKDVDDSLTLLLLHADIDLARVRRRVGELSRLAEEPRLVKGLEDAIARAKRIRSAQAKSVAAQKKGRQVSRHPRKTR
jgi:hypothetical protein